MEGYLSKEDKRYPEKLRQFAPEVKGIYFQGKPELLEKTAVSVVGSRKCSEYGRVVARNIGNNLAYSDIVLISGLARGIDTEGHIGALEKGGNTIAVVAGGTDIFYPQENKNLQQRIGTDGLLLSLKPKGYKPKPYDFPIRNRVISALADSVVIVEATSRSGALITAECAMEQGKNVYAVPGNITSIYSFGTNNLIKEGAIPLAVPDDIIYDMGITPYIKEESVQNLGKDERLILEVLKENGEMTLDEIFHKTNIHPINLNGIMTVLEIKGFVFCEMGKFLIAKI